MLIRESILNPIIKKKDSNQLSLLVSPQKIATRFESQIIDSDLRQALVTCLVTHGIMLHYYTFYQNFEKISV